METIVLVTGGFDPLHSGHISYLTEAKKLGDKLIIGANSDDWLIRKKGRAFMSITERINILENLKMVDGIILFDDRDGTAKEAIKNVRKLFPHDRIIFANGGDRTTLNVPEMDFHDEFLDFKFEVGGNLKLNSSSWILQEWKAAKTTRHWGYFRVLHEMPGCKVKELVVNPFKKLSLQRHFKRSELWYIAEGTARVVYQDRPSWKVTIDKVLEKDDHFLINKGTWHRLVNETDHPLKVIEIQYGEECTEEDIERDPDAK
jgi:cytidyltransferase-like protein